MSNVAITERQQNWLDHIRAGESFDGSLAEYARSAGLKPKELYSWKGVLGSRGLLDDPAAQRASGFVRDGTTHVIFEPLDFIARLAALVPKPRVRLTRFHEVFAPSSSYRARVTPGEAWQGQSAHWED